MRPYTETIAVLASIAETRAVAVFTRWESGDLTDEEFVALVTAVLWRECARGVALADVALAAVLSVSQGSTVLSRWPWTSPEAMRTSSGPLRGPRWPLG